MNVEKCSNFKRFITSSGEVQWDIAVRKPVNCAGFSIHCTFPDSFKSDRDAPNDQIIFPHNMPTLEELEERVRRSWEERSNGAEKPQRLGSSPSMNLHNPSEDTPVSSPVAQSRIFR